MEERFKQHKGDVRRGTESNAGFKHVKDTGHAINWEARVLENEKRMLIRKWKEAEMIKKVEKSRLMNWTMRLVINVEGNVGSNREEREQGT